MTLLFRVPSCVTTLTLPVVAPLGTVAVISELDKTLKAAAVPLNVTLVAPAKFVPRILTAVRTLPEVGCVSTNGPRPTDRLKTVPQPLPSGPPLQSSLVPPKYAVPQDDPFVSWTRVALGENPSAESKLVEEDRLFCESKPRSALFSTRHK